MKFRRKWTWIHKKLSQRLQYTVTSPWKRFPLISWQLGRCASFETWHCNITSTRLYLLFAFHFLKYKVIYNARSNKSHPPTSPNTAPATQNKSHDWPCSHMEGHLQCAEQQESSSNFTKYCACHAKWISWLIRITYETSFTLRGATKVILQLHQILRLARKMHLIIDPQHIWHVIYNARSN